MIVDVKQSTYYREDWRRDTKISIIIVCYHNVNHIARCIPSILDNQYADTEIIVVDNSRSTECSQYIKQNFPQVRLICPYDNLGFGGANNLAVMSAIGEYLIFLNPDTVVAPGWLEPLVNKLRYSPQMGMVTSKILLMSSPDRINVTGNYMHFAGFGYPRGWLQSCAAFMDDDEIFSVSGAAFAISRDVFYRVGGFDDIFYPAYVEDIDLSWRLRLMGYKCGYVPTSVVYHDYTPTFNIDKFYMLETHRQQMLIKNYRWRTLMLLLPSIVLGELVAWGYALASGTAHVSAKAKSYGWLFRKWSKVMAAKRLTQRLRVVSDRDIVKQCVYKLAYDQAGSGVAAKFGKWVVDPMFFALYHISLFLLRW